MVTRVKVQFAENWGSNESDDDVIDVWGDMTLLFDGIIEIIHVNTDANSSGLHGFWTAWIPKVLAHH